MSILCFRFIAMPLIAAFCVMAIAARANGLVNSSSPRAAATIDSESKCDFTAYVNETDHAGLNVRAAPSAAAKVLGKLPKNHVQKDGPIARVEVNVLASKNGWFLINDAQDNEALLEPNKPRKMYKSKGWVSGKKLAVKTQANRARFEPSVKAQTAFLVGNVLDGDSLSRPAQLVACRGKWAQVEYTLSKEDEALISEIKAHASAKVSSKPTRLRGWVNQLCDVQETTCSGLRDE
jgi:uncharacterized protein YgiM (DUF1202 family)